MGKGEWDVTMWRPDGQSIEFTNVTLRRWEPGMLWFESGSQIFCASGVFLASRVGTFAENVVSEQNVLAP